LSDIDILGPLDRRRVWSAQEKAALLAEIDAEGGKVRLVARRHQISESLLYNWRSARKAAAVAMGAAETVEFVPIGLIEGPISSGAGAPASPSPEPTPPPLAADGKAGSIEIALPNGARVSVDAFVSEKALSRVLRAMKAMA
jgi:transposase-like protein